MAENNKMTETAYRKLETDVEALEGPGRREIAARIKTAREWGDLKENAEYHAAKDEAAMLEAKIARMRERLRTSEIVEAASGDRAGLGSTVTFADEVSGKEKRYQLVSATDADPGKGLISADAPMGRALQDTAVGDVRTLETPSGPRSLKILAVEQG